MMPSRPRSRPRRPARPLWRRIAACTGIVALLLQVLFPAHGIAAADSARVPVCTGGGIVWKVLAEGPEAPAPATDRLGADCPFCLIHAAGFAPAAPAMVPFPVLRPAPAPRSPLVTAHVAPYFRAHGSRGPPAVA